MKIEIDDINMMQPTFGNILIVERENGTDPLYMIVKNKTSIGLLNMDIGYMEYSIDRSRSINELITHFLGFNINCQYGKNPEEKNRIVTYEFADISDAVIKCSSGSIFGATGITQ